jgi:hypothetical protein
MRAEVVPYHAQVLLVGASRDGSVPEFVDGAEPVVATSAGIAVGTRSDFVAGKGAVPVMVEVWSSQGPSGLVEIWRGEIAVGERGIAVGSLIGSDLHELQVRPGQHRVAVLVSPDQAPDHVAFVID